MTQYAGEAPKVQTSAKISKLSPTFCAPTPRTVKVTTLPLLHDRHVYMYTGVNQGTYWPNSAKQGHTLSAIILHFGHCLSRKPAAMVKLSPFD